jgi:hypothetical protein
MTDRKTFEAMLTRAGIPFANIHRDVEESEHHTPVIIEVGANPPDTVVGYSHFRAEFEFNEEGALRKVGIWE